MLLLYCKYRGTSKQWSDSEYYSFKIVINHWLFNGLSNECKHILYSDSLCIEKGIVTHCLFSPFIIAADCFIFQGRIDLFKNSSGKLIYKVKDASANDPVKGGDQQEKVIYQIIKDAGNKGQYVVYTFLNGDVGGPRPSLFTQTKNLFLPIIGYGKNKRNLVNKHFLLTMHKKHLSVQEECSWSTNRGSNFYIDFVAVQNFSKLFSC